MAVPVGGLAVATFITLLLLPVFYTFYTIAVLDLMIVTWATEVTRYRIQNTLWWIGRTGIDGIREDTVPYVPRRFWRDCSAAIHARDPAFEIVGEVFASDPAQPSFFQGGRAKFDGIDTGLDSVFYFPLQDTITRVFTGKARLRELPKMLAHDSLYADPARLVTFLGLHDMPRFLHRQGATAQDLKQAFTFLLTTRGTP